MKEKYIFSAPPTKKSKKTHFNWTFSLISVFKESESSYVGLI